MNKYILIISFLLIGISAQATDIINYAYDNAGNRISRKVVLYATNLTHAKKQTETPAPVEEQLGERKITVYPNPTKGNLAVEILGGDEKDELRIIILVLPLFVWVQI